MESTTWSALLDNLDIAGLLDLRAEVDARIAHLGATEAEQEADTDPKNGGNGQRRGGGRWVELKVINNCGPYAYERWFEGKVKRSRYLGKVVAV
ncbi:MAG: hypothetical protein ACOYZ7_01220 [Chloroflexota bacterium]